MVTEGECPGYRLQSATLGMQGFSFQNVALQTVLCLRAIQCRQHKESPLILLLLGRVELILQRKPNVTLQILSS
jgi:hypothetical protein